jgi:membrane protein required for colicin V production
VILLIGFFSGLVRGFVRGLLGLVGLFLGIMLAAAHYEWLASRFLSFLPGEQAPVIVSFVVIFLAVVILVGIIARIIAKAMRLATLGWLDRLLGGVLGVGIASVVIGVLLLLAVLAGLESSPMLVGSRSAPMALDVTDLVVRILPENARATVEEHYDKLRAEWDAARERRENLVLAPLGHERERQRRA